MASLDSNSLISYLSGGSSLSDFSNYDADVILRSLKKEVDKQSDFLTALKQEMLTKAALAQQIGSM